MTISSSARREMHVPINFCDLTKGRNEVQLQRENQLIFETRVAAAKAEMNADLSIRPVVVVLNGCTMHCFYYLFIYLFIMKIVHEVQI